MRRTVAALIALLLPAVAVAQPSPTFTTLHVNGAASLLGGGTHTGTFTGGTFSGITLSGTIPGTATLSGTITIPSPGVIGATVPNAINGTTGTYTGNVTVGKTNGGNIVVCDNHVGPNNCDAVPLEFPSFTALRSFQPNVIGNMLTAHTAGFATAGDGGGALYDWVATQTCANDFTYCVIPTGTAFNAAGRWMLRVPAGGLDVRNNGAQCNVVSIASIGGITIGAGSPNLTVTGAAFTSADVGKAIYVAKAGTGGNALSTTILTFTDATHIVLAANAVTAVTGGTGTVMYGTDDTSLINAVISRTAVNGGGTVVIPAQSTPVVGPSGCLINSGNLVVTSGVILKGLAAPHQQTQANTKAFNSAILLNPSFTIAMGGNAVLRDLVIFRAGLAQKPSTTEDVIAAVTQWAGESSVAVTANSSDLFQNLFVVGFNKAFSQIGGGNVRYQNIDFDAINGFDLSNTNDINMVDSVSANAYWSGNVSGTLFGIVAGTPTGGAGFTNGDSVTASDGTCGTHPIFTLTVVTGSVTAMTPTDVGSCTVAPTGNNFTGGTGTGLTATLTTQSVGYRPGIFYYNHDGGNTDYLTNFHLELFQIGVKISNSINIVVMNGEMEGGSSIEFAQHPIGLDTENCSTVNAYNLIFNSSWEPYHLYAKTDSTGLTCNAVGNTGFTHVVGGLVAAAANSTNTGIHLGPGSTGIIDGTRIGINPPVSGFQVIAEATSNWTLSNLQFGNLTTDPWISIDSTATINTRGAVFSNNSSAANIGYIDTGLNHLFANGSVSGNGADLTLDDLTNCKYTLPKNYLQKTGDALEIAIGGGFGATTDNKTALLSFGGVTLAAANGTTAGNTSWSQRIKIVKTGASTQSYVIQGSVLATASGTGTSSGTLTATDTGSIVIKAQGQNVTNSVANSVTCQVMTVDLVH